MTDALAAALDRALAHVELGADEMEGAMEAILSGAASPARIAALAIALRMKGETAHELAAAARVMRRHAVTVDLSEGARDGIVLDTCGTGGDSAHTINVSTIAALVVAACGVRVAKHGNRALSSRCGSADVLEALGARIDLPPERLPAVARAANLAFLFAPAHHGALRHAAAVRRELGVRTFFNLLGPLASPARATHQLVGVYDGARVTQLAEVLGELGVRAAWVVHGEGGLDELSPAGPTRVAELRDGRVHARTVSPEDFGVTPFPVAALRGGDATHNAAAARAVLDGDRGPARDAVRMAVAAALVVAGVAGDPRDGMEHAAHALDSGAARATLDAFVRATQGA